MQKTFFSIKWKFLLLAVSLVVVPSVIVGIFVYNTYREEAFGNTCRDLKLIVRGWYTATDIYHEELARVLKREEYLFEKRLFSIVLDVQRMVELNEKAHGAGAENADRALLLNEIAAIKIGRSGYAFILDKQGNYVLSQGRKYDGHNILSIFDEKVSREYREIIEAAIRLKPEEVKVVRYQWQEPGGSLFRQKVAAIVYLPSYGWIIGACAYATDYKSYDLERIIMDELKDRMARQKIGEHGYIWAINSNGVFIVSKDRLRDGENIIAARSGAREMSVVDIIREARSLKPGEPFIKEYDWRDLGEKEPRRMVTAVVYYPGWDWIIGASAYEQDFLRGLLAIRWQITQICIFFIVLGSLIAYFFAFRFLHPILALEKVAVKGDLNEPIDSELFAVNDEIGNLAKAFGTMMGHLKEKMEEIEQSRLELLEINEELRHAHNQLFRSEKLAAIGRLAAGVAHEINNPLAYVMSNLETLEQYIKAYESVLEELNGLDAGKDSWKDAAVARDAVKRAMEKNRTARIDEIRADLKDLIPELYTGLQRVKKIVQDLRIFSRVEHEDKAETDLEGVLEKVIMIAQRTISHKVHVVRDYGNIPQVFCHGQRIEQVLMNIFMNAAQVVDLVSGVITVKTRADEQFAYIEIMDNGPGIGEESLARIFEPFFTTKPVGEGTGLGLSISYEIIKKHGGDIKVASRLGEGTQFTVVLPIAG